MLQVLEPLHLNVGGCVVQQVELIELRISVFDVRKGRIVAPLSSLDDCSGEVQGRLGHCQTLGPSGSLLSEEVLVHFLVGH